ncbi:MAG TPA: heavy metal translocating P-type ATPase metal-binding domain-containing protein, partial [Candidatus Bathyarchaeia archaeon]|nr:heavy metal translocating P-type ATPase metal-binding domain-containing protein [Candidatus Bathyarchaeia archaeon]
MRGACAHCELPLGRRPITARVDGEAARFCCFGCALAMQITRARGESGAAAAILVRLGLAIFFAINVMMASMLTYVPYVYGPASLGDGASAGAGLGSLMHLLAALLAAPVMMLLGWPIVAGAWRGVRGGALNLDLLIALGTFAAYGLSLANLLRGRSDVYFDTAAMLLVLVTLG